MPVSPAGSGEPDQRAGRCPGTAQAGEATSPVVVVPGGRIAHPGPRPRLVAAMPGRACASASAGDRGTLHDTAVVRPVRRRGQQEAPGVNADRISRPVRAARPSGSGGSRGLIVPGVALAAPRPSLDRQRSPPRPRMDVLPAVYRRLIVHNWCRVEHLAVVVMTPRRPPRATAIPKPAPLRHRPSMLGSARPEPAPPHRQEPGFDAWSVKPEPRSHRSPCASRPAPVGFGAGSGRDGCAPPTARRGPRRNLLPSSSPWNVVRTSSRPGRFV